MSIKDIIIQILLEKYPLSLKEISTIIRKKRKVSYQAVHKAITELKNTVAELSIDIAEKILKSELADKNKQNELVVTALKDTELN